MGAGDKAAAASVETRASVRDCRRSRPGQTPAVPGDSPRTPPSPWQSSSPIALDTGCRSSSEAGVRLGAAETLESRAEQQRQMIEEGPVWSAERLPASRP